MEGDSVEKVQGTSDEGQGQQKEEEEADSPKRACTPDALAIVIS